MLQELSENTGAQFLVIVSTVFFLLIFTGIALRVLTRRRGSYDSRARLPLEGDASAGEGSHDEVQEESPTGKR